MIHIEEGYSGRVIAIKLKLGARFTAKIPQHPGMWQLKFYIKKGSVTIMGFVLKYKI